MGRKNPKADPNCEFCGGYGEVEYDDYVYPGEYIKAPIGIRMCICITGRHCDKEMDEFLPDKVREIPCKDKQK